MSEERSFSETVLEISSEKEYAAKCERIVGVISEIKSETVICSMGIFVTTEGVKAFAIGNDAQLAKMLLSLAATVRNSMQEGNNPPTPTDEVKH